MPPYNTSLLDGRLAWRQHDGGHTDGPNWKHFIPWASTQLARTLPGRAAARGSHRPRRSRPPRDPTATHGTAHEQLLAKARQGRIDLYFEGDSITRRWGATDYPQLLIHWKSTFFGWNAADFGWGADGTQNILWRLEHGELDDVNPKVIVLLAGTNNIGTLPGGDAKIAEVTRGVAAIVDDLPAQGARRDDRA